MSILSSRLLDLLKTTIGGLQALSHSSVYFSSILYKTPTNQLYLINKNSQTPKFQLDWHMYLIFKAYARTILTTGKLLREEMEISAFRADTFDELPEVKEFFYSRHSNNKQNVFVLSEKISDEEVEKCIDTKLYNPVLIEREGIITKYQTIPKQPTVSQYLKALSLQGKPILFQSGSQTFTKYLQSQKQNLIDTIMITIFQGPLPASCLGKQITLQFSKFYTLSFKSQPFPSPQGTFQFHVYSKAC